MKKIYFLNVLLFVFLFSLSIFSAEAATITVNDTGDAGPGNCDTTCTFRDAIASATTSDTILFDDSLIGETITLSQSAEMDITTDLTITGPGSESLTIDFNGDSSEYIYHTDGDLDISGLTITNGDNPLWIDITTEGNLTVTDMVFDSNIGEYSALYVEGNGPDATITNSTFSNNFCTGGSGEGCAFYFRGGGLLTIENTVFHDNTNDYNGGAVFLYDGDVTVSNSTFYNNSVSQDNGGAIYNYSGNLTITDSTFYDNSSENYGGAIYISEGSLSISDSTFTENSSTSDSGGAIFVSTYGGDLTIDSSTFDGNTASSDGGAIQFEAGAGTSLDITNSTFSNNSSGHWAYGIINAGDDSSTASITNSTFYNNSTDDGEGILSLYGTSEVANSLFYSNTPRVCDSLTSGGHNIIDDDSCDDYFIAEGDIVSTDPLLDTVNGLADNGGPVKTIALLTGSPAINAGNDAEAPSTDARGYSREGVSDIGAYEYITPSYTITSSTGSGGTISPNGNTEVEDDEDQTYTITPDLGYTISDVLVDDVSVGAVSTYTFENVSEAHTISATFAVEESEEPTTYGYYAPSVRQNTPQQANTTPSNTNNSIPNTPSSNSQARDLKTGDTGNDVKFLQTVLNTLGFTIATEGPGSKGNETTYFGELTRQALIRFQQERGVEPAVGYFGPLTRTALVTYILELIAGE